MKLQLHEITPELIRELSDRLEADEIRSLVRAEVRELSEEFRQAKVKATELLARCQIRAIKLDNLGVERKEIASMFDVPVRTVASWIRSDVTVMVRGR